MYNSTADVVHPLLLHRIPGYCCTILIYHPFRARVRHSNANLCFFSRPPAGPTLRSTELRPLLLTPPPHREVGPLRRRGMVFVHLRVCPSNDASTFCPLLSPPAVISHLHLFCFRLVVVLSVVSVSILSSDTATDSIGSFVDIFNVCLYASPLALAWKVGLRR